MSIIYDLEFFGFRFAAGSLVDLNWDESDDDSGDYYTVCRHKDAALAFETHATELLKEFPGHDFFLARGDKQTFRHEIWPAYKANRKSRRPPAGYGKALARMIALGKEKGWITGGFPNIEADDLIGMAATHSTDIRVSDDKDMLTLPGLLYRNGELLSISEDEANKAFYAQVLIGDTSDNYPGCKGIADKNKLFRSEEWQAATTEPELWKLVLQQFEKAGFDEEFAITQARCARILRPGEFDIESCTPHLWQPPVI